MDPNLVLNSALAVIVLFFGFLFNRKLESIKSLFQIKEKLLLRKIEVYPKFIGPVYRLRNLLRDFTIDFQIDGDIDRSAEKQLKILRDTLIDYRLDLKDRDFRIIHTYKNKCTYLLQLLEDFKFYTNRKNREKINETRQKLFNLYEEMDSAYMTIADNLSFSKFDPTNVITEKDEVEE